MIMSTFLFRSKMVNVNAPLPFNLNNSTPHRPPPLHTQQPPQQQQMRLDRFRARRGSPQPSFDMERQSVLSSASASASPSQETYEETARRPVLNVRIVRPGSALARGRPITREAAPSSEIRQQQDGGDGPRAGAEGAGPEGCARGEQDDTAAAVCFYSSPSGSLFAKLGCLCDRVRLPVRKQRRRDLQPHSRSKTLARSREVGVIDLEHLRCFIPCCLLISDVIIHPIHPSIIAHTRISGSFLLSFTISTSYPCAHDFHLSLPPILSCIHSPTHTTTRRLTALPITKKGFSFPTNIIFSPRPGVKTKRGRERCQKCSARSRSRADQRMD